jgi:FAD/FMN-containing dehydrogenase
MEKALNRGTGETMAKTAREYGFDKSGISRWIRASRPPAMEAVTNMCEKAKRPQDWSRARRLKARNRCFTARRAFLGGLAMMGLGSLLPFARPGFAQATSARPPAPGDLSSRIKGPVVVRGEAGYEVWRQSMVWQLNKPDRYPALIVRPNSVDEVREALCHAHRAGLKVAVKSGGHSGGSNFLHDGGMLIDMWNFSEFEVDAEAKTAWAGPTLQTYTMDLVLARFNLAFPVCHCASVPLGGFLLGGGFGYNGNSWGHASCFSVLAADVVTADGELRRVTAEREPDLYWALRGGGVGFPGVVMCFHLQLYPRPRFIATSQYVFPMTRIAEVADWLTELTESELQQKTELRLDSDTLVCNVLAIVFADSETEARSILGQLARHPMASKAVQKSEFLPTDFKTLVTGSPGRHQTYGLERKAGASIWTEDPKEVLVRLGEWDAGDSPAWRPSFYASYSPRREPLPDAAFSVMDKAMVGFVAGWDKEADDAENFSCIHTVSEIQRPFATGYHINYIDVYGDPEMIRRSFSTGAWKKLRAIRQAYDPEDVFHDFLGPADG